MASTYTTNAGIELITTGEQSGTWGDTTNINLQIIDRLTNGVGSITLSGTTHTLTTTDGALSDGQYQVLVFGGSPSGTNTVTISPNDQQKFFVVKNNSGESVVLTQGSGSNATIANGNSAMVYADGAGAGASVVDLTSTFPVPGALLSANNLSDLTNVSTARSNLGVAVGSDVQAFNTTLQNIANGSVNLVTSDANGNVSLSEELQATAYIETVVALSGTSVTVNCNAANVFTLTTSGNTTFTFDYSGVDLTTNDSYSFTLRVTAGGSHTLAWPASVDWPGGTAPDAPLSGDTDVFVFFTTDGGTTWYGFRAGDALA